MKKAVKNPWSFAAPEYDQRSSIFVDAGTHYGVGKTNPVGHEGSPKQSVSRLPMDCKAVGLDSKRLGKSQPEPFGDKI